MRLALAQIRVRGADRDGNRERALAAVADAADRGADLVALPELWNVGYFAFETYERAAEPLSGPTLAAVREAAADHGIAVLAGSVVEDLAGSAADGEDVPAEEGLANTAVLFDADGERRAVYRKHHLFGYESAETRLLTPGEALPVVDLLGFRVAVTTCYDLRFPEQFRALGERGADLVLVPSAWPYPRVEHWRTLPRARAIENLSYVATANGSGSFEDAELVGRSTVYDPWGTTLASAGDDPALVTAEVEPERVARVREEFPALRDGREYRS
ncbi:carbon-nitrogen family hydrolase [Halobaculum sp. CBA1158]|uniref:nitrilase-related carbon-nitrogen hydrolase n=1 Tax=Halobaculum sp. CBA1158 TaxID=2904243 RepID=UPI001F17EFCD|nr:nitrilase-related carbon-nitrogen hydrolase [Halobaculum sp. CBA1158]UIO99276.1 carbon-nitrogen family hydrolase [Halobaculum sp. CBA1158]